MSLESIEVIRNARLRPLTRDRLLEIKSTFSSPPEGYIEFLEKFGAGTLDNPLYKFYDGPVDAAEVGILSERSLSAVGDNFGGIFCVFEPDGSLSTVDREGTTIREFRTFIEYLTYLDSRSSK